MVFPDHSRRSFVKSWRDNKRQTYVPVKQNLEFDTWAKRNFIIRPSPNIFCYIVNLRREFIAQFLQRFCPSYTFRVDYDKTQSLPYSQRKHKYQWHRLVSTPLRDLKNTNSHFTGLAYADACHSARDAYSSGLSEWSSSLSEMFTPVSTSVSTSLWVQTYFDWDMPLSEFSYYTLCDGHTRIDDTQKAMKTSTDTITHTTTLYGTQGHTYSIHHPSCSIRPEDCVALYSSFNEANKAWTSSIDAAGSVTISLDQMVSSIVVDAISVTIISYFGKTASETAPTIVVTGTGTKRRDTSTYIPISGPTYNFAGGTLTPGGVISVDAYGDFPYPLFSETIESPWPDPTCNLATLPVWVARIAQSSQILSSCSISQSPSILRETCVSGGSMSPTKPTHLSRSYPGPLENMDQAS